MPFNNAWRAGGVLAEASVKHHIHSYFMSRMKRAVLIGCHFIALSPTKQARTLSAVMYRSFRLGSRVEVG